MGVEPHYQDWVWVPDLRITTQPLRSEKEDLQCSTTNASTTDHVSRGLSLSFRIHIGLRFTIGLGREEVELFSSNIICSILKDRINST